MARGEKPRFSITARRKDAPRGSKDRVKLGAAWDGKFPGAYNALFGEVREMVLMDGTVVKPADHYFDLKDWTLDDRGTRSAEPSSGTGHGFKSDDDIPFHHEPRRAKDVT